MAYTLNANALTELATIKTELGIAVADYDQTLIRMINSASDFIQNILIRRKLHWEEDIVEKYAGYGQRYLVLKRRPVSAISSITYNGTTVSSDNYEIHDADAGILFAPNNWVWTAGSIGGIVGDPWPGTERKQYEVTYDAGWVTPKQVTDDPTLTRTLPYDIEDAVLQMVSTRYLSMGQRKDIKQERLTTWSAMYGSADTALQSIFDSLSHYMEIV